jgi:hypothetical protein
MKRKDEVDMLIVEEMVGFDFSYSRGFSNIL